MRSLLHSYTPKVNAMESIRLSYSCGMKKLGHQWKVKTILFSIPKLSLLTFYRYPGVEIGEIGPKLGMKGVNNGFLGFDNVRVPRKNMLMKNAKVLEDGTYVKAPSSVLTYGTMMFVRVVIIRDMANYLSKAVTIVTRYSAVR